jgi:hypothetical protein
MNSEQKAYESFQAKIRQVLMKEMEEDAYTETQWNLLDIMLANVARRSGGADKVTLAQVQGVKEMLEEEFGLAAAMCDDPLQAKEGEQ